MADFSVFAYEHDKLLKEVLNHTDAFGMLVTNFFLRNGRLFSDMTRPDPFAATVDIEVGIELPDVLPGGETDYTMLTDMVLFNIGAYGDTVEVDANSRMFGDYSTGFALTPNNETTFNSFVAIAVEETLVQLLKPVLQDALGVAHEDRTSRIDELESLRDDFMDEAEELFLEIEGYVDGGVVPDWAELERDVIALLESLTLFTSEHFNDMMMVLEDIRTNNIANLPGTLERLAAIMDSVPNIRLFVS